MNKQEAYQAMLGGFAVRNQYYDKDEYVFINSQGEFETEDTHIHGGIYDEFWSIYQNFEDGWEIIKESDAEKLMRVNKKAFSSFKSNPYLATDVSGIFPKSAFITDPFSSKIKRGTWKNVEPSSNVHRNDPCMCGSGLKYKKCCGG